MADNGGNLICLDLTRPDLDWVQDTLDDSNCTPVLEVEDGHPYVYKHLLPPGLAFQHHGGRCRYGR